MNNGLAYQYLANAVFAFLIFLFSFFGYLIFHRSLFESNDYVETGKLIDDGFGFCGNSFVLQDKDPERIKIGKELFKMNCASCHAKNMRTDMTGPPLGGVLERWEKKENLYAWIRNSQAYLQTDDEYAAALFKKYKGSIMNPFPDFSNEDIDMMLEYVEVVYGR